MARFGGARTRILGGLTAAALLCGASSPGVPELRLRDPGERLPALTLYDLGGKSRRLAEAPGGGPILILFWSVYCPNCKDAMPELVKLHERWRDRGIALWAINVDGDRFSNAVKAYVDDMELTFPVLLDRLEGDYLVAADPLGVSKTPTLYLAEPDGTILLRQVVEVDFDALTSALSRWETDRPKKETRN